MKNVYNILTPWNYSQTKCVVAENMAEAERLFLKKYPYTKILKIELYSEYVIDRNECAEESER
jgi:hypothetical protein